jgi:hypothetical protein
VLSMARGNPLTSSLCMLHMKEAPVSESNAVRSLGVQVVWEHPSLEVVTLGRTNPGPTYYESYTPIMPEKVAG